MQGKGYVRQGHADTFREVLLQSSRLPTQPNVSVHRFPALPLLQEFVHEFQYLCNFVWASYIGQLCRGFNRAVYNVQQKCTKVLYDPKRSKTLEGQKLCSSF